MSAYKKIKCEIVNKEILIQALKVLGLSPIDHKEPVKLQGYLGDKREEKAEIIVPKKSLNKMFTHLSNDLGFRWNNDSRRYDMICSDYDVNLKVPERIKQAYAKIAIETALEEKKFCIQHVTPDNELQQRTRNKVKIQATRII